MLCCLLASVISFLPIFCLEFCNYSARQHSLSPECASITVFAKFLSEKQLFLICSCLLASVIWFLPIFYVEFCNYSARQHSLSPECASITVFAKFLSEKQLFLICSDVVYVVLLAS